MKEKLDIVDEDDEVIGVKSREKAHTEGSRHRSVMFFVFNPEGKILMTKRSKDKRFYPGRWSIVLGGHVTSGFSYEEALEKEMKEEIGIVPDYEMLGSFQKDLKEEKENVKLFRTEVEPEKVELSTKEFEKAQYMDPSDLEKELESKKFVPETEDVLKFLGEYLR